MPRLHGLDLRDLVAFDVLMRERHVTRAAARLGMSQPALSHALQRLRTRLSDELFVREPQGMVPTARALELGEPIRRALSDLESALSPAGFDPESDGSTFTLALNNGAALTLAGDVSSAVWTKAPGVTLVLRPSGTLRVDDLLDSGELDAAIVGDGKVFGDRFGTETLSKDGYAVLARKGHPLYHGHFTYRTIGSFPHMELTSTGDRTDFMDGILSRLGLPARRISLRAPLLSAGAVLAACDAVTVASSRIARALAATHPLEWRALPPDAGVPVTRMILVWSRRLDAQPANAWLRRTVSDCIRGEEATAPSRVAKGPANEGLAA